MRLITENRFKINVTCHKMLYKCIHALYTGFKKAYVIVASCKITAKVKDRKWFLACTHGCGSLSHLQEIFL